MKNRFEDGPRREGEEHVLARQAEMKEALDHMEAVDAETEELIGQAREIHDKIEKYAREWNVLMNELRAEFEGRVPATDEERARFDRTDVLLKKYEETIEALMTYEENLLRRSEELGKTHGQAEKRFYKAHAEMKGGIPENN